MASRPGTPGGLFLVIGTEIKVDTSAFDAAIADMQRRLPTVTRDRILRREVQLVGKKLVQNEWRAKPKKVREDLRSRLVLLWDSGSEYNVPKQDIAQFRRAPKGTQKFFRARKQPGEPKGKLIDPKASKEYVNRVGYLASGWVAAAQHFGANITAQWALRHNHSKTGSYIDNLNTSQPHAVLINKAGPQAGSRQKLEATLRVQARSMQKQMEREIDVLMKRYYP